ncbi:MAG: LD-carboxypeptidase [Patescibacteria group bacterium]
MLAKRLKRGDTIGLVCPSSFLNKGKEKLVDNAINILKQDFGLNAVWGKNARKIDKYGISAGTPQEKADDINKFFADHRVQAIWCATGGNTANQVLDYLDFTMIKNNPKIFIGLSDNTVFLNAIYKMTGLVTMHGPDAKVGNKNEYFDSKFSQDEFKKRLIDGDLNVGQISKWQTVRQGKATGKMLGGNIICFLKLLGTKYFPDVRDSILLMEEYDINIKKSIWLLTQYKQAGIFDKINGIIVGDYYHLDHQQKEFRPDGGRILFENILLDITKDYNFPILKIYEFGHKCPSTILPIGVEAEMDASKKVFKILKDCVK